MAWTSVVVTLRARNSLIGTPPERSIDIDALAAAPYFLPEDTGQRSPGEDGTTFNNVVQRMFVELQVRRFRIDAGEWDFGDYLILTALCRAKYLDVTAVQDAARVQTATTLDGLTDFDFWDSVAAETPLPWRCTATLERLESDYNLDRSGKLVLTLAASKPTIGVTIT